MTIDHNMTRAMVLPTVIQLIMKQYDMDENAALDAFYRSATGASFGDDETGLYGQSPNFIFGLFVEERKEAHKEI